MCFEKLEMVCQSNRRQNVVYVDWWYLYMNVSISIQIVSLCLWS